MMLESFQYGVFIKQKFELFEALSGCESANKYLVYEMGMDGDRIGTEIFVCKEESSCCSRKCLKGSTRPFKMKIHNHSSGNRICMEMDKPYKCCITPCNRPEMKVTFTENGTPEYFGKIVDNYDFCNYSFSIMGPDDKLIFTVVAKCMQCGFMCQCGCQACERVVFKVYRGKVELQPLLKIGKKSCTKNLIGDADNFSIPFPKDSTYEERSLLMATGLFIDYMMFEEKQDKKKKKV